MGACTTFGLTAYNVSNFLKHPFHDSSEHCDFVYDIGIMILRHELTLSLFVKPALISSDIGIIDGY